MKSKKKTTIDLPVGFRTRKEKREFWLIAVVTVVIGLLIALTNFGG